MKAICWYGAGDVRFEDVPDPILINDRDAIVKVTSTAICGSDLHILNGLVPTMKKGDVLGHEFMGEVIEVGSANKRLKVGDRVVVPFTISCGHCFFCKKELYALCDNSNPNAEMARAQLGQPAAGIFGYSHMMGGYYGGQAEYVRIPHSDIGPIVIENSLSDEQLLFLSDIFPTGYMAAENAQIEEGDTVAIWGCGPVGQFAIQSAWLLGAGRVIAIDCIPERLALAEKYGKAEIINFQKEDVYDRLMNMTQGRGPDSCIDAVGAEAHVGPKLDSYIDKIKEVLYLSSDRPHTLREAIHCCRKGGTISIPGVYFGKLDDIPFGAAMNKGLTFKMGQTNMQHYQKPLLKLIEDQKIDLTFIITHRAKLKDGPEAYKTFRDKKDGCVKVVMTP